ncbi:MAG: 16S rRNA (adenine(1518)-N(6)/adenine(1519)-N(6))-dimethyltransferase RsmA [Rickettsiales bacterium]|jgi:16S rRNA (adenine1518-N6/adenine1519-N6)-dimethyltransferase|nr:16S rRNA (adenine(1518)-N(6)/adenine(1519)-N(6))-dimethyltransferase RsmA [Rickettsiales bacterium]
MQQLPTLAATIHRYGLDAKKSLGQHFLLDEGITEQIVRYAGDLNGISAIEIGPGPGGLTRSLLRSKSKHVYVVEKDDRAIAIMHELAEAFPDRLTILHEDALSVNLLKQVPPPRRVIANLPYNVGTQLLLNWLEQIYATPGSNFESLTLMFQKEVAERITAAPGSKAYGSLSVFAQWLCEARWDMDLPPEAFSPPPKVHSAVITLTPREKPLVEVPKEALEKVLASAFNQRRKMLRVSLKTLGVDIEQLLAASGIDGTKRAEQLSVEEFCRLAAAIAKK